MPTAQRLEGTGRNSIDGAGWPVPLATVKIPASGAYDFTWPPMVICAVWIGFLVAFNLGSVPAHTGAGDLLQRLFAWYGKPPEPEARPALVITANPRDQLTVVATLSPRGFNPLLAGSEREVRSQIRAYPGALKLAVVDATLRDYAGIVRALKDTLPIGSIIVLKGSHRPEDVGPMLLDRL